MMLEFGQQVINTAKEIINECVKCLENDKPDEIEKIKKKHDELFEKYNSIKKEDVPKRYFQFWYSCYKQRANAYIITFQFLHINRRNLISPDGFAIMETKWVLVYDPEIYGITIYKEI